MTEQQGQLDAAQPAAVSATAPAIRRRGRWLMWLIILCAVLAAGSTAIIGLFGPSVESFWGNGNLVSVTVMSPWLKRTLVYALPGSLAAMLVSGVVALCRRRWLMGAASVVGSIVMFGMAVLIVVITIFNSPCIDVEDQCRGPDGKRYAYLTQGFIFAGHLLGRQCANGGLRTTYDVVGHIPPGGLHSGQSWVAVIRPASCSGSGGRLLPAPGGWLVGLRCNNECYFAYEVSTDKFLEPVTFNVNGSVGYISPLILMGPDTEPLAGDVAAILSAGSMVPGTPCRPIADLRAEASKHPNARIREMFKPKPMASTGPAASSPRKGRRVVATGGAQRNPWKTVFSHIRPVRGGGDVPSPLTGREEGETTPVPRVSLVPLGLRSTRGYIPRPRWGRPNAVAPSGLKEAFVPAWGSEI